MCLYTCVCVLALFYSRTSVSFQKIIKFIFNAPRFLYNKFSVFENREKMVLVMEYAAGGELYDFLSERKVLAEEEARRIFRQIATAVYYCHKVSF